MKPAPYCTAVRTQFIWKWKKFLGQRTWFSLYIDHFIWDMIVVLQLFAIACKIFWPHLQRGFTRLLPSGNAEPESINHVKVQWNFSYFESSTSVHTGFGTPLNRKLDIMKKQTTNNNTTHNPPTTIAQQYKRNNKKAKKIINKNTSLRQDNIVGEWSQWDNL